MIASIARMRRAVAMAALLAGVVTGLPRLAHAQAVSVSPIEAPAACPDAEAFYAELAARAPSVRRGGDGSPWTFRVRVVPAGRGYAGTLHVEGPSGALVREAKDASCASVVTALAVVAALAVTASPPPPALPLAPEEPPPPPPPAPPERSPWRLGVGAFVVLQTAAVPAASWGFASMLRLEREAPSVLVFDLQLGFRYTASDRVDAGPGGALVTLAAATVDACILQVPVRGPLRLRACPGASFGALRAEGRDVAAPQVSTGAWASLALALRLEWAPLRSYQGLWLGLSGGLEVPLTRHRFVWQPSGEVGFEVPPAGFLGQAGLGARFF